MIVQKPISAVAYAGWVEEALVAVFFYSFEVTLARLFFASCSCSEMYLLDFKSLNKKIKLILMLADASYRKRDFCLEIAHALYMKGDYCVLI